MSEIRSYRRVFDLERRIYAIDRVRLNPSGVPLRGLIYAATASLVLVALSRLPLLGRPLAAMPWFVRDLGLPGAVGAMMGAIRIDGRCCHTTLASVIGFARGSRRLAALRHPARPDARWLPGALIALPGSADGGVRRMRYRGPGVVVLTSAREVPGGSAPGSRASDARRAGRRRTAVQLGGVGETRSISVSRRRVVVIVPARERAR